MLSPKILKLKPPLQLPKKGMIGAKYTLLQRRASQIDREIKSEKAKNLPTQAKEKYKGFIEKELKRIEEASKLIN